MCKRPQGGIDRQVKLVVDIQTGVRIINVMHIIAATILAPIRNYCLARTIKAGAMYRLCAEQGNLAGAAHWKRVAHVWSERTIALN